MAKERLTNRPDSEHEQALFRIVIAGAIGVYFYFIGPELAFYISLFYLPAALGMLLWIIFSPGVNRLRRLLGITADIGMVSLGVILARDEAGVVFVAIYLWIITGNGFRFGIRYLLYATLLSLAAFILIMINSPYWHQHVPLVTGQLIIIAVVPLFMASLIRKLHDAIRAAETANRAKSRFIANISHELRTPLNGIIGMNNLSLSTKLNKEQKRFAYVIEESAYHLLRLIERLLDMSKIEAGKLELVHEPFDLHQLLHGVVVLFKAQARDKGIIVELKFNPEIPFILLGDPKCTKQILLNIVGNAVKFTEHGSVMVNVDPVAIGEHQVRLKFTVIDTGIGMPEEVKEQVFERFAQADSGITRRFGGTGLGTTIARNLAEIMGGSISLESREGEGSIFTIELPFDRPAEQTAPKDLSMVRALLLAKEAEVELIGGALERWGADYTLVEDEKLLLSSLVDAWSMGQPYDAVIFDKSVLHCKPELLARAVRDKPDLSELNMILLEPEDDRALDAAMAASGYFSILHLPLQESLLFNAMHAASVVHHSADVISIADILKQKHVVKPLRIHLAEDNPVNQEVIEEVLKKAGHTVHIVEDGEQALDALSGDMAFDLILLDMNMPRVSGLEVLKHFRFMDTTASTPVLMLSADALPETIRECMEAGANEYITKPVHMDTLLEKVAEFAGSRDDRNAEPARLEPTGESDRLLNEDVLDELFGLISSPQKRSHLLHAFETNGESHLTQMQMYAQQGEAIHFLEKVHALKGSAATLGVQCVVARCVKIERDHGRLDSANMLLNTQQLRASLEQGCSALRAYLQRISPNHPG